MSEKESARAEQEQALTEARASLEGLQKEVARIGEEHSALRVEQAGLEERRRSDPLRVNGSKTRSVRWRIANRILPGRWNGLVSSAPDCCQTTSIWILERAF